MSQTSQAATEPPDEYDAGEVARALTRLADGESLSPDETPTRPEVMALLASAMQEAHRKIRDGRIRDPQIDHARLGYFKALCNGSREYREHLEDRSLDEMRAEIEDLKAESTA